MQAALYNVLNVTMIQIRQKQVWKTMSYTFKYKLIAQHITSPK